MRRLTVLFLVGMLALGVAGPAFGQALPLNSVGSARLQAAATANGNGTNLDMSSGQVATFQVSGTFSATVNYEGSLDNTNWSPLTCYSLDFTSAMTSSTAATFVRCNASGIASVRARISNYVSGSVTVLANASAAVLGSVRRLDSPIVGGGFNDANNLQAFGIQTGPAGAGNNLAAVNAVLGDTPQLTCLSTLDPNCTIQLLPKGTYGGVNVATGNFAVALGTLTGQPLAWIPGDFSQPVTLVQSAGAPGIGIGTLRWRRSVDMPGTCTLVALAGISGAETVIKDGIGQCTQ